MIQQLRELDEAGPFAGTGPHRIQTHNLVPPLARVGVAARFLIDDTTTGETVYHGTIELTITAANVLVGGQLQEVHAATGWAGAVLIVPSLVLGQPTMDVTIPDGFTVRIYYEVNGSAHVAVIDSQGFAPQGEVSAEARSLVGESAGQERAAPTTGTGAMEPLPVAPRPEMIRRQRRR